MVGGPGGSLVSGRDFSLAQMESAKQRRNETATITKPITRSRTRAGSLGGVEESGLALGGLSLGVRRVVGASTFDAGLGLDAGFGLGGLGSKPALHTRVAGPP